MSSLARNRPLTLQSVACLWLGQQAVMAVAAVAVAAVAVVAVAVPLFRCETMSVSPSHAAAQRSTRL